jgi:hypothetical protein
LQNRILAQVKSRRWFNRFRILHGRLRKGERWSKPTESRIGEAAAAVPVIRKLLRECNKSKQWKKSDGWSAEQFAAEIYEVGVDQIARHLKHGRRRYTPQ